MSIPSLPIAPRSATGCVAAVLLVAVLATSVAAPPVAGQADDEEDPALDQTIEADQEVVEGEAVLDAGHIDLGPRWVDGEWTLLVHDDAQIPSVWRSLDDVVLHVHEEALQQVPDDPTYGFLGIEAGTDVHVIPQVEVPGVVWLGWNTQDPEVLERIDLGATLTMVRAQGPGTVTMYLQAGNLSDPDVLWESGLEERQPIWVEVNTHTHANWVFSEPGAYLVEVEVSADLVDGSQVSDVQTLRFAVGDETFVDEARSAVLTADVPPEPDQAGDRPDDDGSVAGGGSTPVLLALIAGGVLLLGIAVLVVVRRGARAKRRAASDDLGEAVGGMR